jgi:hypothetical protein
MVAPIALGLMLGVAGWLGAQAPAPQPPPHGPLMRGAAPAESGGTTMSRDEMRAQREAMLEQRRAMMEQMRLADAKLDTLIAQMDGAQGSAKVDALAEVVRELVAERRAMRSMMESMPMMRPMPMGGEAGLPRPMRPPAPPAAKGADGTQ